MTQTTNPKGQKHSIKLQKIYANSLNITLNTLINKTNLYNLSIYYWLKNEIKIYMFSNVFFVIFEQLFLTCLNMILCDSHTTMFQILPYLSQMQLLETNIQYSK